MIFSLLFFFSRWTCVGSEQIKCRGAMTAHGIWSSTELKTVSLQFVGGRAEQQCEGRRVPRMVSIRTIQLCRCSRKAAKNNTWLSSNGCECRFISIKLYGPEVWISHNFHVSWDILLFIPLPPSHLKPCFGHGPYKKSEGYIRPLRHRLPSSIWNVCLCPVPSVT